MEFFKDINKIKYEGKDSANPLAFKYYNPDEIIDGKPMREQLKFALSWWHTMGGDGTDMFGCGTTDKTWGESDSEKRAIAKVDAAFEIMDKLSIDYYCFHDRDLSPEYGSLSETNAKLDTVVDYCAKKQSETGKKLLWGTAKCFDHPRFMHGAGTSPSADVFAFSAAQIKKALEATVKLGGNGYVFWGGREGYETLLNTDMGLELDNMARLMKMAVDYGRSIGFKGDFYIEPKPKEPTKHQYDFDTATVLGFLRKYGLDKDFKMNIEANHATLAQHTFQHELCVARINGAFGSIDANQGDSLLGWDTDQFPTNIYETTMCMYEVIKAGGLTGGFNLMLRLAEVHLLLKIFSTATLQVWTHSLSVTEQLLSSSRTEELINLSTTDTLHGKQVSVLILFQARLILLLLKNMLLKRARLLLHFQAADRNSSKVLLITFFLIFNL